jgi:hypothetical protein
MSSLKMKIYTASTGVEKMIAWANEKDYKLGYKFLTDIGALDFPPKGSKPASFYLKTKEQRDALYEFRRSLRQKTAPSVN